MLIPHLTISWFSAVLRAPSLGVQPFGLDNAVNAPSLGVVIRPYGLGRCRPAALVTLNVTLGDTATFSCQLGGHILLNSVHLSGGSLLPISHATINWLLVTPEAPSFTDIDVTINWDISPSETCTRGSTQQYAATLEIWPRYWPFGLDRCSMISALVAALLAALIALMGTDMAIFNCQLGVLHFPGGSRARLSAFRSLGITAARDTVALFTSPSRNAVAPMSTSNGILTA